MILSSRVDDNNAAYVEIILDIFEDSVAIHSVQGVTVHEDPELFSLVKKTYSPCPRFVSLCFERLVRISSRVSKSSKYTLLHSQKDHLHQLKSAAVHALKALKLIG
ncbi:hypothetical protein Pint_05542 [Pistacia integerrima]|uniref:Uncharacterized protein n=1 Tax=Pistacia integerrima TaxID=434235 RepID=A0ACC0Z639_9ROSI|nr:hypothetical protein Pint_05542 [Pistacia integerrima]